MSGPFLELVRVAKRFGGVQALDGVDLSVGAGELLVVLGPNGAGKTTLLRTIAGLEAPDAGVVRMAGVDVTRASPAERDIALVFQNFSLYPGWTVRANLEFPLRAPGRRLPRAEIATRVGSVAETLRISHLLERDARRLSGGEMQRVAIGRALVRRPRLFLMDEPLTNLDAKLREALRVEIVELVRSSGTPMLFVTHDQAEALSMGDRIVVLSGGRVQQVGEPEEVYLRPCSPLVARQLGQPPINLFEARREGDGWRAEDGTWLAPAESGGPVKGLLGVRAEHVAAVGGTETARVEVVEDLGHARVVLARFAGKGVHLFVPRELDVRPGSEVRPRLDPSRIVVWTA
jgi:multiple sugar transport system ATP-binding protein